MILKGVILIDTSVLWYVIAGVITLLLVVLMVLGRTKESREEQRRLKEYRKRQEKAKQESSRKRTKPRPESKQKTEVKETVEKVPEPFSTVITDSSRLRIEPLEDEEYFLDFDVEDDDTDLYVRLEDNPSLFEKELEPEKVVVHTSNVEYQQQSLSETLNLDIDLEKQDYVNKEKKNYSEAQFQDLVNQFRNDKTLYRTYDVEYRAKKYVEDSMVLDNSSLETEVAQVKIVQELLKFKKYVPIIALFLVFITGGTFLFGAFIMFFIFQANGVIDKNNAAYLASQLLGSANHLTMQEALFYAKVYRKIKLDSYESIVDGLTIGEWYVDQQQRESLVDYTTFKEIKNELQK